MKTLVKPLHVLLILAFCSSLQPMGMSQKTQKVVLTQNTQQKNNFLKIRDCEICFDSVQPHEAFACSSELQHAYHHTCLFDWLSTGKRDFSCIKCHKHNIDATVKDKDLENIPIETIGSLFDNKILTQKQVDQLYRGKSVYSWRSNIPHAGAWFCLCTMFRLFILLAKPDPLITESLKDPKALFGLVMSITLCFIAAGGFILVADDDYISQDQKNFNMLQAHKKMRVFDGRKNITAGLKGYACYYCALSFLNLYINLIKNS